MAVKNTELPTAVKPEGFESPAVVLMSLTSAVPAATPLDLHSSLPTAGVKAPKKRVPLLLVSDPGKEPSGPGRRSVTRTVPNAVPSERHSSWPWITSLAEKKSVPLTFVREMDDPSRREPVGPGTMSFTSAVPAAVPSLCHSSGPWVPSSALKKRSPLTLVSSDRYELLGPGLMSFTSAVPAAVPSLCHSSYPVLRSKAMKKRAPLTLVR